MNDLNRTLPPAAVCSGLLMGAFNWLTQYGQGILLIATLVYTGLQTYVVLRDKVFKRGKDGTRDE